MALDLSANRRSLEQLFEKTRGQIAPGLERTRAILEAVGNPERRYPAFHVAGTNGKGSTCAAIDALLRAGGLRVGRYASPHLVDPRERFLVNGAAIAAQEVDALLATIEPVAEHVGATFFEITTALAFAWFAEREVDVAVIETGLGGRLDSTNVLDPLVAAVTNVSIDHTEYLGDTVEAIAAEKAGIFKRGRPAVIGEPSAAIAERLRAGAAERGAAPVTLVRERWLPLETEWRSAGMRVVADTPRGVLHFTTPLMGEHQAWNALTAMASVSASRVFALPSDPSAALARVAIPGRFQRVGDWIFDVAHNAAGAAALARALAAAQLARPVTLLLAVLRDKEWGTVLRSIAPVVDEIVLTTPPTAPAARAWDPADAGALARSLGVAATIERDFDAALARVARAPGTHVVAGSFHTVGDAMQRLGIDPLAA